MAHNGILRRIHSSKSSFFLCYSVSSLITVFTNYRWGKTSDGVPNEAINHSPDAILVEQYTSDFFVEEARKCNHKFTSEEDEDAALIYNYQPTKTSGSFVQEYFFHF